MLFGLLPKTRRMKKLTWDLVIDKDYPIKDVDGFILPFLFDVKTDEFIPVPKNTQISSAEFVCDVLKIKDEELTSDLRVKKFIPVMIKLDEHKEISELITGYSSSMENSGVTHAKEDIQRAHQRALQFIEKGNVPINKKSFSSKVDYTSSDD